MSDTDQETTSPESSAEDLPDPHESTESGQSTQTLADDNGNRYVTPKGIEPVCSKGKGAEEATTNIDYGIGCITRDDMLDDVLVQQSAIVQNNPSKYLPHLGYGEMVELDVLHISPYRNDATKVTGPGGIPVRGSPLNDTTCHRSFRMRGQMPSRGHLGSDQEADVPRDTSEGRRCSHCGFLLLQDPHLTGPRGARDQEAVGDPAAATDHAQSHRGRYIRRLPPLHGPRSYDNIVGDKNSTGHHFSFCSWRSHVSLGYPQSPKGRELGRDITLATYRPLLLSHKSSRGCLPLAGGSKGQQRARDAAAESPHVRPGSCMDHRKPLHGPQLVVASKKHTDHDQPDDITAAQGTQRWMPDHHKGLLVRRLPPLQNIPVLISPPVSPSGPRAVHLPGATLATGLQSAMPGKPGLSYNVLRHPRHLKTIPRPRFSASHSERKPGAQHMQGPPDARDPQKKPLPHYKASDPKDLHCSPQAPPPEAQVHNTQDKKDENEKGAEATPAPPWAKPSASKEDPTNPLTQ